MAHLHNLHSNQRPSFLSDLGNKVRTVAEIAGTAKGIYDAGKMAYTGIRMAGPMLATAGLQL